MKIMMNIEKREGKYLEELPQGEADELREAAKSMSIGVTQDNIERMKKVWPNRPEAMKYFDDISELFGRRQEEIREADIIIGAVLVPGSRTPMLITRDLLKTIRKGSVIIDVSIDQGGCFETSMPTTHDNPVYIVDGIIHYAVANMPGAYPRTSTLALTNATLPYIVDLAGNGIESATRDDSGMRSALNTCNGEIMNAALKESFQH